MNHRGISKNAILVIPLELFCCRAGKINLCGLTTSRRVPEGTLAQIQELQLPADAMAQLPTDDVTELPPAQKAVGKKAGRRARDRKRAPHEADG